MPLFKRKKPTGPEPVQEVPQEPAQTDSGTEQGGPFPFRDESLPWNESVKKIFASEGFEGLCTMRFVSADGKTIAVGEMPVEYGLKDAILEAINDVAINKIRYGSKEYYLTYNYGFNLLRVDETTGQCETSVCVAYMYTTIENRLEGNFDEIERTLEERLDLPEELRQLALARSYEESEEADPILPDGEAESASIFNDYIAPEDSPYPDAPQETEAAEPQPIQAPNLDEILLSGDKYDDKLTGQIYDHETDSVIPVGTEATAAGETDQKG